MRSWQKVSVQWHLRIILDDLTMKRPDQFMSSQFNEFQIVLWCQSMHSATLRHLETMLMLTLKGVELNLNH